jgi:hypothetical protein
VKRVAVLVVTVLVALAAPPAAAEAAPGALEVLERSGIDQHLRAVGDTRGGLWVSRSDGIHHRSASGAESGPLSTRVAFHLAADPRNGDLVFDGGFDAGLFRLTTAGAQSTITADAINVTAVDVGPDGSVYAYDSNGLRRFSPGGAITTIESPPSYLEAIAVAADGTVLAYAAPNVIRRGVDGTWVRVAGNGIYCMAPNPCGDDGPAADASFGSVVHLDVAPDGTIYVGELYGRVRRIRDGRVEPIAGSWERCYLVTLDCNEGAFAPRAYLDNVVSMSLVDDVRRRAVRRRPARRRPWLATAPDRQRGDDPRDRTPGLPHDRQRRWRLQLRLVDVPRFDR